MSARLTLATQRASDALLARGWSVATAESCTGGLVAKQLTDIGGSSVWFDRGFVTYSNAAKIDMLGVRAATLETHGAVSAMTAREMALGALAHSRAHVAVAITGIAGPSGGLADKPVGTVWFAIAVRGGDASDWLRNFQGDRGSIRDQAAQFALELVANAAAPPAA